MNRTHGLLLLLMAGLAGCDQATAQDAKKRNAAAPAAPAATPACCASKAADTCEESPMPEKVVKTDEEWKKQLTPEQYNILREKGTERAFTGKYWNTKDAGTYRCAGCGAELFTSDTKFDSGCGWPSFTAPVDKAKVQEQVDTSHGMVRTEVLCARCGGHLGHVFNDGPGPTGLRYCINSVSIDLKKAEAEKVQKQK